MNVFGNNAPGSLCSQGTSCSKFFNALPIGNAIAGGHDRIFNKPGGIKYTPFSNVATMLPAAAVTFSAVVGNSFQGWQNNPLSWYFISQEDERKRDKRDRSP